MSRLSHAIAIVDDIDHEDVYVEKWGVTLRIQGMDGHGRARYLRRIVEAREEEDDDALAQVEAEVLIECCYDPQDGTKAFDESDIGMLLTKHGGIIGMLSRKALVASGLDAEAEERLGKSSSVSTADGDQATPNDASTSS